MPAKESKHDRALFEMRMALRSRLGSAAEEYSASCLRRILRVAAWDADLAATALTMAPRPGWVLRILAEEKAPKARAA